MTSGQRKGLESSPAYITNYVKITGFANPFTVVKPKYYRQTGKEK